MLTISMSLSILIFVAAVAALLWSTIELVFYFNKKRIEAKEQKMYSDLRMAEASKEISKFISEIIEDIKPKGEE